MPRLHQISIVLALIAAGCTPPSSDSSQPDVSGLVSDAAPGITITGGEVNASGDQYEVTGTMPNGDEVELDLVQSNGAWVVDEIQRDVTWATVPEPVRAAAAAAPDSFEPVRVIESTQSVDGSIVYELFRAAGEGGPARGPALEVRWYQGNADLVP